MKTRTEFKKNHVGAIAIRLDRFYYAPGDTVTGSVLFNCTQPAVCEGLVLKFTGKEEAEWEDRRTRTTTDSEGDTHIEVYYEHVEKDHTNFKTKVKLSPDGWVCQPGARRVAVRCIGLGEWMWRRLLLLLLCCWSPQHCIYSVSVGGCRVNSCGCSFAVGSSLFCFARLIPVPFSNHRPCHGARKP